MSRRRLEARRAQQTKRREDRHRARADQRRLRPAGQPEAAIAPRLSLWKRRSRWIAAGVVTAVLVAVAVVYVYRSVTAPLPGERFPDQGLSHLADISEPHPPYNSNPPTSGWHTAPMVRPGIYTQPRVPENIGHNYEHGGVWILYNCPDGCEEDVTILTDIVNTSIDKGRPVALAPYPPLDTKFTVSAWRHLLEFDALDSEAIDTIENFIGRHACRFNPEGGPYCSGVRGKSTVKQQGTETSTPAPVTATPFSVFSSQTPAPSSAPPVATSTPGR